MAGYDPRGRFGARHRRVLGLPARRTWLDVAPLRDRLDRVVLAREIFEPTVPRERALKGGVRFWHPRPSASKPRQGHSGLPR